MLQVRGQSKSNSFSPPLTKATDACWRPIKYSLFPPLATLAGYLSPDDRAVLVGEHVEPLTHDDAPELVVIQAYITNAYRAYRIADHYPLRSLWEFGERTSALRTSPASIFHIICRRMRARTRRRG